MAIGFTLYCHELQAPDLHLLQPRPGSQLRPSLVSHACDSERGNVAVLLGRLLYRRDLLASLPGQKLRPDCSDAELALAAFRHAGPSGLERLEGEFALVLWDASQRCCHLLRDPFGAWPLFWTESAQRMTVSTRLSELALLQPQRCLDREYLAEYLSRPFPQAEIPVERTAFQGVQRVLAGTRVVLSHDGTVRRVRYWDWSERIQAADDLPVSEAAARFFEHFERAIQERMHGRVAAHLSGGMDSSSIVCLARDALARGVGQGPLTTLSMVYNRPSLAGERQYIDLVRAQGGPLDCHVLEADKVLDFDWFDGAMPQHDEPYGGLPALASARLLNDVAADLGAQTVLTGIGADEILDAAPFDLADRLRCGRVWSAVKSASVWARAWNQSFWSVLRPHGLDPLFPVLLRDGLGPYLRRGYGRWPDLGWFTVPPWVQPSFASEQRLWQRGREQARRMYAAPTGRSVELHMLASTAGDWSRWHLAGPHGMNVSHPFRDPRLVCFTLGLPAYHRMVPGQAKPLLREAMRGILPESIRTRRGKRGFDDVYGAGLSRHLPQLEDMLRDSTIGELGLFDVPKVAEAVRQASLGVGDVTACERMDKALAMVFWHSNLTRQFSHARQPVKCSLRPVGSEAVSGIA